MSRLIEGQQRMADQQNQLLSLLKDAQRQRAYYVTYVIHLPASSTSHEQTLFQDPQAVQYKKADVSLLETLGGLLHERENVDVDIQHILASQELLPREHKDQADTIVSNHVFRPWITAPTSMPLLIHGNFDGTHYVSALSYFCTTLLRTLQTTGQYTTLVFFCGRHIDPQDTQSGGRGMIRSLLAQLLQQHQFNTRDLADDNNMALVESGNIDQLTTLFRSLTQQLDGVTLFCIIDGIKYYERDIFLEDMSLVLAALLDIAEDERSRNVFKLLITSPSPTHFVRRSVLQDKILSLDAYSLTGDGFNESRVARDVYENIHETDF